MRGRLQAIGYSTIVLMCSAIPAVFAQGPFTPAHYLDGALPQIPLLAVGGGEVLLELTVSRSGVVNSVRTLRATPPFTDLMSQVVHSWRFAPAQDVEPEPGSPGAPTPRQPVASNVLVAGMFRAPTINTPTLGELPTEVAPPSNEIPFPVAAVMPAYMPLARDSGILLVEVLVDPRGTVAEARVIHSAPPFDETALDAARQWRFRPARVRGVPVASLVYIAFAFRQPITVVPND